MILHHLRRIYKCISVYPAFSTWKPESGSDSYAIMSMGKFADEEQASLYAQYRPTYPETVYKTIVEYLNRGSTFSSEMNSQKSFDLAVDVGCGSGQSTVPLCKYFKHVIGYDVSETQISHAPDNKENVTFKVGPGEDLSFLADCSTDLITSAQAVHWLDREKFYAEVRRVLKHGGVCAVYGYGINRLDNLEAQTINEQVLYLTIKV
jgi:SAM-dependent methyltransferase